MLVYRHVRDDGCIGHKAVSRGNSQALTLRQRPAPTGLARHGLDHPGHATRVHEVTLGRFVVVPGVAECARVDATRRPDQLEKVVLRVALRRGCELIDKTRGRECMWDVGYGSEPSDARMCVRFGHLHAEIRNEVGEPYSTLSVFRI